MFKVLIVEDEVLVSRMYQKMAKGEGFDVVVASNGETCIEKAKEWKPNIILMDIMMPKMNGIEALEKLKADEETKDIPVVMLTNLSGKHDAALAVSKGAVDLWVKKDLEPKLLKENLLAILKK